MPYTPRKPYLHRCTPKLAREIMLRANVISPCLFTFFFFYFNIFFFFREAEIVFPLAGGTPARRHLSQPPIIATRLFYLCAFENVYLPPKARLSPCIFSFFRRAPTFPARFGAGPRYRFCFTLFVQMQGGGHALKFSVYPSISGIWTAPLSTAPGAFSSGGEEGGGVILCPSPPLHAALRSYA